MNVPGSEEEHIPRGLCGCRIHTERTLAVYPGSAEGWQRGTCRGWKAEVEQLHGPEVVGSEAEVGRAKALGAPVVLTRPLDVLQLSAAADPKASTRRLAANRTEARPPRVSVGAPWPTAASTSSFSVSSDPHFLSRPVRSALPPSPQRVPHPRALPLLLAPYGGVRQIVTERDTQHRLDDSVTAPIPTAQPDGTQFKGRPLCSWSRLCHRCFSKTLLSTVL